MIKDRRTSVYETINKERDYQDSKWGGSNHDNHHTAGDWLIYMQHHLDKAKVVYATADSDVPALEQIRKVTALGVACMEFLGAPPR